MLQATLAQVAFKNLMTHGSAIRTAYRTSLRSSSLWEPRHPPLKVVLDCYFSRAQTHHGIQAALFALDQYYQDWSIW